MSTQSAATRSTLFNIGWITLLVLSGLASLLHLMLLFTMGEQGLFLGWAALNLYSLLVLWIPFGRREKWAWFTTWIVVIAFAAAILIDPQIGLMYTIAAAVMALALLLTAPAFFQKAA